MNEKILATQNKLDLIDTIILVFYYLFVCFSFLALFGFFNRFLVYLILFILVLFLFFFRQSISFNKKYLWFFLITPLVTAGFGFLRGFFTGDAYWLWLPIAREIVVHGQIPDFLGGYYLSQMPLLSLLFAGTFALFNSFNEFLCLWVPFFFTAATLIVLYQWAKDKNLDKKFLFFIPFLFLTNLGVAFWGGWNLLQESILLFFATTFFCYYEKYLAGHQRKDLIFFIFSFVLVIASKLSGLFLALLIPFLFFREKNKKRFLAYLFFFSVPILFWFLRNYLVYDNPVFPLLNSLFKGRYALFLQNSYFPGYFHVKTSLLVIFGSVTKYLWLSFPFILLSFYGFLKKRRYEYLILFLLFFLLKEIFYFTITVSVMRYYYLFLGLFLVYALLGLEQIKSRLAISGLVLLAVAGLLLVPVTDSSSAFISSIEDKVSFFGQLFDYLHNYWYLVLIILIPFAYRASRQLDIAIFLIFLYSLYILHLQFIANKSWLNTWPFIFLSLLFLIFFALKDRIHYVKQIIIAFIILVVFFNSWGLASVYYWHQGNITLPVPFIWQTSHWAREILDKQTSPAERDNFYILIAEQPDYFNWWTDYQAINLFDFDFWLLLQGYDIRLSDLALHRLFVQRKVRYLVKNEIEKYRFGDRANKEFEQFFEKIKNSNYFKLIASQDDQYFIWQVY